MRFLKEKKGIIISFIIGVILASSITVYATTTYLASQVTYKDGKSVADALNDLYNKETINLQLVGSYSLESTQGSTYTKTFDLKVFDNYQNLQSDNFYVVIEQLAVSGSGSGTSLDWADVEKTYNSSTGILTITIPRVCYNGYGVWLKGSVYLKNK